MGEGVQCGSPTLGVRDGEGIYPSRDLEARELKKQPHGRARTRNFLFGRCPKSQKLELIESGITD